MLGSPGSGKTLLASAMPGILPELSLEESLEVTRIYSVADAVPPEMMMRTRPFRAPQHAISHSGLVGGGNWPHPGEISLTHRGVLFLDEHPEIGRRVLEVKRQPIEDKVVTISRVQGSLGTLRFRFGITTRRSFSQLVPPRPSSVLRAGRRSWRCAPALRSFRAVDSSRARQPWRSSGIAKSSC